MRIGIAQISTRAGDFSRTGERIVEQSKRAAAQGVDLLVFPVATLTGPHGVPRAEQRGYLMDTLTCLFSLAELVACPCLVPAVVAMEGETATETFLLFEGDVVPLRFEALMRSVLGELAISPRVLGGSDEVVSASDLEDTPDSDHEDGPSFDYEGFASFEAEGIRFVLACGFDDLYELVDYDYQMDAVIFLPSLGFAAGDPARALGAALTENTFRQDARTCGAWLVAAGSLGCYDTSIFTGGSFVLSPAGELVASAPSFEEALLVADIAGEGAASGVASWADGAVDTPEQVFFGELGPAPYGPAALPLEPEVYDAPFFCWEALTLGLRDYVANLGRSDVALVLDGTLASSVLAVLACDALGPLHVHALIATPLAGTSYAQGRGRTKGSLAWRRVVEAARRERSCRRLATNLRISPVERDQRLLAVTAAALEDAYAEPERLAAADLEEGVIRSELALLAARTGSLTLSACDRTWLALEARPGAAAADLLPLGDLYRSDVLELARMRNVISPVIPDMSPAACDVPALELDGDATLPPERPGSRSPEVPAVDQALLRAVDSTLSGRFEWGRTLGELSESQGDEELVAAIFAQVARHAPARASACPILRAGSADLGEERLPYALAWQDRVRNDDELFDSSALLDALSEAAKAKAGSGEQGPAGDELAFAHRAAGVDPDQGGPADILGYLRDLADELGATPGMGGGMDGHLASYGDGHLSFGGLPPEGSSPFSEN